MKALFIVECDVPDPDAIPGVLKAIDPPSIPYFTGTVRIVPEPHATALAAWLDEE